LMRYATLAACRQNTSFFAHTRDAVALIEGGHNPAARLEGSGDATHQDFGSSSR